MANDNFIKLYEDSFKRNWDKLATCDYTTKQKYTYGELAVRIDLFHRLYRELGINQGDKIAVCGRNSSSWIIAYMSAVTYGGVVVPILDEFNPYDLNHILSHSDSVVAFFDDDLAAKLQFSDIPTIRCVVSLSSSQVIHSGENCDAHSKYERVKLDNSHTLTPQNLSFAERDSAHLAAIYYTSGTVSLTKGVMLTGLNLAGNVRFALDTYAPEFIQRSLVVLPLAHAYGTAFDMLTHLAAGGSVTLLGKVPSPQILLAACQEVKPTLIFVVPLVLEKIYKNKVAPAISKPLVKLALKLPVIGKMIQRSIAKKIHDALGGVAREIIVGGAAINREVEDFFIKGGFPMVVGYGMTECAPLISWSPYETFVPGSVGRALKGFMEVKIDKATPSDHSGEILVKGVNVMLGYYKNQEDTDAVFTPDGWLRTGDLGYIDNGGNIFINGRAKTMILTSNGENIYPEAIESKLNNLPLINESIVLYVKGKIVAYVYPDVVQATELGISQLRLNSVMRDNRMTVNTLLSRYERVSRIVILDEPMPKTPKKTIKRQLAEQMIDQKRKSGIVEM